MGVEIGIQQQGDRMMPRKKIAILGGGMAGLAAAYELTRTPELAAQHDVTIYSMGWRLGGKCASARDALGRNVEHGLHVWFGCYANTFGMMKEVYDQSSPMPGARLKSIADVAKPQDFTPIGVRTATGWEYFPIDWPANEGDPWDVNLMPTLMELIEVVAGWIWRFLGGDPKLSAAASAPLPAASAARFLAAVERAHGAGSDKANRASELAGAAQPGPLHVLEAIHLWADALARGALEDVQRDAEHFLGFWEVLHDAAAPDLEARGKEDLRARMMHEALVIGFSAIKGMFRDLILENAPFVSLDDEDFRAWLIRHGADPKIVAESSFIRIVYDTLYQFHDGDVARPSYAAGTCIGVIGRLTATFKGHMMYELQTGFGEAVVSPLYAAMRSRGVNVSFFSKVTALELDAAGKSIARVRIGRQAALKGETYDPVTSVDGLMVWPAQPLWDQLADGARLRDSGVNFESHWCQEPFAAEEVLEHGKDFDIVALAITMGAYKKLNDDPTMCDALKAASPAFERFTAEMGIVPTQSAQLWFNCAPAKLGWDMPKAAAVSGPEYLNIFADMSQVIATEKPWDGAAPTSLYYLTGTYATTLYRRPAAEAGTPAIAAREIRAQAIEWLEREGQAMWPRASDGSCFEWRMLHAAPDAQGVARFDAQFWRANIDPNECCVLSCAGMTRHRLGPTDAGFDNLILAGEATRTGFNTTAVEGAVMSGRAASRAICGSPEIVVGYDFLYRKPSEGPGQ